MTIPRRDEPQSVARWKFQCAYGRLPRYDLAISPNVLMENPSRSSVRNRQRVNQPTGQWFETAASQPAFTTWLFFQPSFRGECAVLNLQRINQQTGRWFETAASQPAFTTWLFFQPSFREECAVLNLQRINQQTGRWFETPERQPMS